MKIDRQFEKMYAELTAKEKALLTFEHLRNRNVVEADRVVNQVPMAVYRIADPEHTGWYEDLRRFILIFSMECWRYRARYNEAAILMNHLFHSEPEGDGHIQEVRDIVALWETRSLSLEQALDKVCAEENIEPALIRYFAMDEAPCQSGVFGKVDPELVADMVARFSDVFRQNA